MAVDTERANEIIAELNESAQSIISANGLDNYKGTTKLNPIQKVVDDFTKNTMATFSQSSEGLLVSQRTDAIYEIEAIARDMVAHESFYLQGLAGKHSPADSAVWNSLIGNVAAEIDRITRLHAPIISNLPKLVRTRLDDDMAKVLTAIESAHQSNPSPTNAADIEKQAMASLAKIDKDLTAAADASMKASIENMLHRKHTLLQEKIIALSAVEAGMTKEQASAWKKIAEQTKKMINDLGNSNYLVYDAQIRKQRLAVIDQKIALLENMRTNAAGVSNALSGYFGGTGNRRVRRTAPLNGIGSSIGMKTPIRFAGGEYNIKPPGFAGYAGMKKRGGESPFRD